MPTREDVLRSALELPERERAEVVRELLDRLEGGSAANVEAAWAEEVSRRLRQLQEGTAGTLSAMEAFAHARARLKPQG